MRRYMMALLVAAVGLGLLAAGSFGQARRDRQGQARRMFGQGDRPGLSEAIAMLELPTESEREVHRYLSAGQGLGDQRAEQLATLRDKLGQARRDGDDDAVQDIQDKMRELRQGGGDGRQQVMEDLAKVLRSDQIERLEQILASPGRQARMNRLLGELAGLGLNIRQEAVMNEAVRQAEDKIMQALSVEQRDQLTDAMSRPARGGMGGRAAGGQLFGNLSDEQRERIAELREEYRERLANASSPEERQEIMREMMQRWRQSQQDPSAQDSGQTQEQQDQEDRQAEQE